MIKMTDSTNSIEEWLSDQIKEYKKRIGNYEKLRKVLAAVLKDLVRCQVPQAIIQTRLKTVASFAEKCRRKRNEFVDPVNQFTDLCSGRVIVHTADQVELVSELIKDYFDIDLDNSVDVSQRLKPTEFGYRSIHYIVSFKKSSKNQNGIKKKIPTGFPNRRAEIQIRTVLEHAYADLEHKLAYKSTFQIPDRWKRELAAAAAMLESADKVLLRIKEGLRVYEDSFEYMNPEQIKDEIKLLKEVFKQDPGNITLASQIGKLALIIDDWPEIIDTLSPAVCGCKNKTLLRCFGLACCNQHEVGSQEYRLGQIFLKEAGNPPDADIDSLIFLAATYDRSKDEEKIRELYRQAYQLDPSCPLLLEKYLDFEITVNKNISMTKLLKPVIETAIKRCQDQAEIGLNLPAAYYHMGKFYLLLGKPYESLDVYAKAIQLSSSTGIIKDNLQALNKMDANADHLPGFEWVRKLLLIGRVVVAKKVMAKISKEFEDKRDEGSAVLNPAHVKIIKELKKAEKELKDLASAVTEWIGKPVVIVAGGCAPAIEPHMKTYKPLLDKAFELFEGTIFSGGTTQGISGLVGALGDRYEAINTIGYLPKELPSDFTGVKVDERYDEIRRTEGIDFTPLEPLQNWIDIINTGIDSSEVKVLGINGGQIASVEFKLALAFGADVFLVEGSGREAAMILKDEKWQKSVKYQTKGPIRVPNDSWTLWALFATSTDNILGKRHITKIARENHKAYLKSRYEELHKQVDPSLAPWKDLKEELQESNKLQAMHMIEKLHQLGYDVLKANNNILEVEFTDDEIEIMAEIEHGRWNAEKILNGWSWGEVKDFGKKTNPSIVKWDMLSEETKEHDRRAVRKIPADLGALGYVITKTN
jgi:ppGpp synthetase/RelA/SpoT-type nucleotidyltranferase